MNKRNIIAIISFILFIILLILVKTNQIIPFDTAIYNGISPYINSNLTKIFNSISFLGSGITITIICLSILIVSYFYKKTKAGFILGLSIAVNSVISEILKTIIQRPRPDVLRLAVENSYSFPSSHTLASTSACGILLYVLYKSSINKSLKIIIGIILVLILFIIAYSRVYLGVHNASDVLGGFLLAITLLLIEIGIFEKNELLK